MTLRVTFDQQIFAMQARGGISRYFVELMRQFDADPALGIAPTMPFRFVRNDHVRDAYPGRFDGSDGLLRRFRNLVPNGARRNDAGALVHYTYYDEAYLPDIDARPSVSTIHDMIPELFAAEFTANPHMAKKLFVERSTTLICVSANTRRDLIDIYGDIAADISVVHLGVGDEFREPRATTVVLPNSFVLYVGNRARYKDFDVLVAAMGAEQRLADVHLVCIGGYNFTDEEQTQVAEAGLRGRLHHARVSDADLPGVYAQALALAYPSRYEGFGLPVLEAMAAGCPVILTDIGIFHETADEAADYFAPGDSAALADRLVRVRADRVARDDLIARGRLRAADFTWQRTAALTAEVYRAAAGL